MMDYAKKLGLVGIGFAMLTREKAEKLIDELVKKGEISRKEGDVIVKDLMKKSEAQRKELEKRINAEIKKTLDGVGVATKKDIERLERKIDNLAKEMK